MVYVLSRVRWRDLRRSLRKTAPAIRRRRVIHSHTPAAFHYTLTIIKTILSARRLERELKLSLPSRYYNGALLNTLLRRISRDAGFFDKYVSCATLRGKKLRLWTLTLTLSAATPPKSSLSELIVYSMFLWVNLWWNIISLRLWWDSSSKLLNYILIEEYRLP